MKKNTEVDATIEAWTTVNDEQNKISITFPNASFAPAENGIYQMSGREITLLSAPTSRPLGAGPRVNQ